MWFTRALPLTNFVIATSALCFQVGVLYPWHKQLDDDFEALKKEHLKVLKAIENHGIATGNNNNNTGEAQRPKGAPSSESAVKAPEQRHTHRSGILSGLTLWGCKQ